MSLLERKISKMIGGGLVHLNVGASPDDRDDYTYEGADFPCCTGASMGGPRSCTCWTQVYDIEQADPKIETTVVETRETCCDDCAYRNGSPEREREYTDELVDIAGDGSRFFCHKGMRRVVAWRHPNGRELPAGAGDYAPPVVDGVAYRADGTPADLCAGWAAHRRALLGADA